MKIEIDTEKKTITLLEEISLNELNKFMQDHFPNENNYKIVSKQTIQIVKETDRPIIDKITPYNPDPLYPPFNIPGMGDRPFPNYPIAS